MSLDLERTVSNEIGLLPNRRSSRTSTTFNQGFMKIPNC